ncbi:ATP-binding cassette domain-containing protein [Neisseria sp. Ec49-e6-T10]|uniref:ATP-binding cassette domain-containing protein n=1 Tax=Neisseria sp. Ec49-e6-T10 TaxID=3140744 RepID=UPI003EBB351A
MLATKDLCFGYEEGEEVLTRINLDFSLGKVTGIVGANGSGKSTLFMNLLGLLKPTSGEVLWQHQGIHYDKAGLYQLRKNVAMVFQDPDQQIFYTDIKSDIAFSLRNLGVSETLIEERLNTVLTLVDAKSFCHKPIQYLSYGQKKRVAIAGALMLDAPCILLDEPTAGLDPKGREHIIQIINKIVAEGKHVVISSHDIDLIYQICDTVYVLDKGQIALSGQPEDVFLHTERIKEAQLTQPWLVKLHVQMGIPLYRTEEALFASAAFLKSESVEKS